MRCVSQATLTTETTATNATLPFPPAGLTRFRSSEDNLSRHRPTGSTRHTSRGLPRCAFERCNEPPPREVAPKNPVRLLTSPSRFLGFAALSPIRLFVPASPARPSGFASEHFNAREAVVEARQDQRQHTDLYTSMFRCGPRTGNVQSACCCSFLCKTRQTDHNRSTGFPHTEFSRQARIANFVAQSTKNQALETLASLTNRCRQV